MKIQVFYRFLKNKDEIILVGSIPELGNWDTAHGIRMKSVGGFLYELELPFINNSFEYKFVICCDCNVYWQIGGNNYFDNNGSKLDCLLHRELKFEGYYPKFSGVVAPVFSLRHKRDWGIGDFGGLRLLLDFAVKCRMSVVQILPINDTSITMTEKDSYPYNAISTKALNPMFMDLSLFAKGNKISKSANLLPKVDYNIVSVNKYKFIWNNIVKYINKFFDLNEINEFFKQNDYWLYEYAKYIIESNTANLFEKKLKLYYIDVNNSFSSFFEQEILKVKYIQYVLHIQLRQLYSYASANNILLKGDLPIGVNPLGVDVLLNEDLFNTDFSAGAPPDDFATDGQNWGFPTYNWDRMEADNYSWWRERMSYMSEYFSAIRIDHVLGFFRIWQIPKTQESGLLGFFYPSIPLDIDYINNNLDSDWDIETLSKPIIHKDYAKKTLGIYFDEAVKQKLISKHKKKDFFELQDTRQCFYQNQDKEFCCRLKKLCTEVLFVTNGGDYYPRIQPQKTDVFNYIGSNNQEFIFRISNDYFYNKNISLWENVARKRLSAIKSSSNILLCAEDLGMIPSCVPQLLSELDILTLEIERMPKEGQEKPWSNLNNLPYNSVLSTSTHDMPPLKLYWESLSDDDKHMYKILKFGETKIENKKEILKKIIRNHLLSSSLLAVIPLGDWLSYFDIMSQDAKDEQINHPENPDNVWDYRFPFYMEDLIGNEEIIDDISCLIEETERYN